MTMSDRERQALDELARRLAEQDPQFAWALRSWPDEAERSAAPRAVVGHRGRAAERWRRTLHRWQDNPLRPSIAGGVIVVGVLFVAAHLPHTEPPVPAAEAGAAIFTEQIPAPDDLD